MIGMLVGLQSSILLIMPFVIYIRLQFVGEKCTLVGYSCILLLQDCHEKREEDLTAFFCQRKMATTDQVDRVSVDITELKKKLAASIKSKLCDESPSLRGSCIFRVPEKLRRHNEKVFDPNIVAIGPYHCGTDRLAGMERVKMWYLKGLLNRMDQHAEVFLEDIIIKSIMERQFQKRALEFYADPFKLDEGKFAEMLVVDGCFLLELFRKDAYMVPTHEDDPVFNTSWMRENLYHDLILLSNQIPWFILEHLFLQTVGVTEQEPGFLVELVLKFFETKMLMIKPPEFKQSVRSKEKEELKQNEGGIKHILDLLRSCILSESVNRKAENIKFELFPPVTNLLQAGIKFEKGTPGDILNIEFDEITGTFKIPPIKIDGNSECLFRNIIAYEQCDRDCRDQFTSYAVVLDCLINTSMDADLLCGEEIVVHALSTEDISHLFNRLYNDTLVSEFYYGGIARKVNNYCKSKWPRWRATLKRDYFSNPWSIFSLIAAVLLLVLTFAQALFTIVHI